MSKPIIGITSGLNQDGDIYLRRRYCTAIEEAGGVPLILPTSADTETVLSVCGGILLSGGGDILPELYGLHEYDSKLLFEPSEERDRFEIGLARLAFERNLPLLAICRGIQVLNVALGGDLLFDISGHRQTLPRSVASHTVRVESDSMLHKLTGLVSLRVNSFHHQAAGLTAASLRVTAVSDGGTIEALEADSRKFTLGVQWHPEHMCDTASKSIFNGFVNSASIK